LNAVKQFDLTIRMIETFIEPGRKFRLETSYILQLHQQALEGLDGLAGTYRPGVVKIGGSAHTPPDAFLVAGLMEEMCTYVNKQWKAKTALHLCAYVMWRMNWIHPFTDGNGRTARAVAYLVLCIHLGYRLPGRETIPEQIAADKSPYYRALGKADVAAKGGKVDVSAMEKMLSAMLAKQLVTMHQQASMKTKAKSKTGLRLH